MAIKISGTTVIDDSRQLQNIANLKTINGQSILGSGDLPISGGLAYVTKTANYTATDKQGVLADTSAGVFTVTLPATPATGAQVIVADSGNAWGTNNLTVARNGSTIGNLAEDLVCDITGASIQFVYDGNTWEVYAQIGGVSGIDSVIPVYLWENRNNIRGLTPFNAAKVVVEGLGLFVFYADSTLLDDDESCFATANGRWILEAASFDFVESRQVVRDSYQDNVIAEVKGRLLTGTATSTITSLAAPSQATVTATIPGAKIGDTAVVSPDDVMSVRLSFYARVTADDTVTVYITNGSAASATLTNPTTYRVAVIKN